MSSTDCHKGRDLSIGITRLRPCWLLLIVMARDIVMCAIILIELDGPVAFGISYVVA